MIIWIITFIVSIMYEHIAIDIILGIISIFFIVELVIELYYADSIGQFLKENWLNILFLIPIFRVLKIGKLKNFAGIRHLNKLRFKKQIKDVFDIIIELFH